MKRFCSLFITSLYVLVASAQIHLSAELKNNHLWRGIEVADGCVVTTDLSYTFANGYMTLGLWGGSNTQGTYKEFNHYLSIQGYGFKFSAYDTYNIIFRQMQRITIANISIIRPMILDVF